MTLNLNLNIVKHPDLDKAKWDKMVHQDSRSLIFGTSTYLDICAPGWQALVCGDYKCGMPTPANRTAGVNYLYLPFFIRELAIYGKAENPDLFYDHILNNFKRIAIALPAFDARYNIKIEKAKHQYLKLDTIQTIEKNYSKNTKRILKKATDISYDLIADDNYKVIIEGFKAGKGKTISSLGAQEYITLEQLMATLLKTGQAEVLHLRNGNVIEASAYFMFYKTTVTYLKGHVTDRGRKNGSMFQLFDMAIKRYHKRYEILDFGGSRIKNVAEFYKKFGASERSYVILSKDDSPLFHRYLRKIKTKLTIF